MSSDPIEQLFKYAREHHIRNSQRLLDNVGLTVNLSSIPEYNEYLVYVNAPFIIRTFREIFRRGKIKNLHRKAMAATINKILE